MDPVRVLAAVVRRGGRVLLCRRARHRRHGGLWEFPGGKLEPGETLFDAARRELAEELALRVTSVGDVLFVCDDPGSRFVVEFVEVETASDPVALEHECFEWVTLDDAAAFDLAPADAACVRELRARRTAR